MLLSEFCIVHQFSPLQFDPFKEISNCPQLCSWFCSVVWRILCYVIFYCHVACGVKDCSSSPFNDCKFHCEYGFRNVCDFLSILDENLYKEMKCVKKNHKNERRPRTSNKLRCFQFNCRHKVSGTCEKKDCVKISHKLQFLP